MRRDSPINYELHAMTPKQFEKKVRQLTFRRRLIDTVETLEDSIRVFMTLQGRTEAHSGTYIVTLREGILEISTRPAINLLAGIKEIPKMGIVVLRY